MAGPAGVKAEVEEATIEMKEGTMTITEDRLKEEAEEEVTTEEIGEEEATQGITIKEAIEEDAEVVEEGEIVIEETDETDSREKAAIRQTRTEICKGRKKNQPRIL